jgi:hypothetical protein
VKSLSSAWGSISWKTYHIHNVMITCSIFHH